MLATEGKLVIKGILATVDIPQEHHRQAKPEETLVTITVLTTESKAATADIPNTSRTRGLGVLCYVFINDFGATSSEPVSILCWKSILRYVTVVLIIYSIFSTPHISHISTK
jgi:hypothetical protein